MSDEKVRVYDFETQKITTIPAAELASGMIKAQVEGIDGEVYVEASQVRPGGDYRHPPFDEERKAVMRQLAEVFADVYPITAEQWEDGFRRDMHIDKEIGLWCRMAQALQHFTEDGAQSLEQRREIYQVISACVTNGPHNALRTVSLRTLARPRAKAIIAFMEQGGNPST